MTESQTEVETDLDVLPFEMPADDNMHLTHVINPPMNTHIWKPGMSSRDVVDIARSRQQEITALCGFKWVPKFNPDKFPACAACMNRAAEIIRGRV